MKRVGVLVVVGWMAWATAWADIVEVRGKGLMTGSILSQDDKEMTFKDNEGRVTRFAKSDVLFFDRETAAAEKPAGAKTDYGAKIRRFFEDARYWPAALRDWTDGVTKKFRDFAGKPLDRGSADAKGEALSKVMDEAAQQQAELVKRQKKVQAEIRRLKEEAAGGAKKEKSGFDGTFGKL